MQQRLAGDGNAYRRESFSEGVRLRRLHFGHMGLSFRKREHGLDVGAAAPLDEVGNPSAIQTDIHRCADEHRQQTTSAVKRRSEFTMAA